MKVDGRPIAHLALGRRRQSRSSTRLCCRIGSRRGASTTSTARSHAIQTMVVRGAPLIGATAAYGLALALREDAERCRARARLRPPASIRPTAVNLRHALDDVRAVVSPLRAGGARGGGLGARRRNLRRGRRALPAHRRGRAAADRGARIAASAAPVNVLTHCNAGWLATVDWGTATAPIYHRARSRRAGPCVRRRDAAAQSGRRADRLRTRPAWRAAYARSPTTPAAI